MTDVSYSSASLMHSLPDDGAAPIVEGESLLVSQIASLCALSFAMWMFPELLFVDLFSADRDVERSCITYTYVC